MNKHTPIVCEEHADEASPGGFQTECLEAQAQGRILELDYRCQVIAVFNEDNSFVDLSRSLAGTFVISIVEPLFSDKIR